MHHGSEFTVVLIAGVALLSGAVMRLLSARTRFPYTIAMLLLGIATGIALRHIPGVESGEGVLSLIAKGASIGPDLIIFVFLPTLVFESAYAIDVREFRKNLGAIVVLAVPALVLSTLLVAGLMVGLGSFSWGWGWGWPAALVFGALISATDPVAVVAILRELGVSKRLGVLIEGESLLNDGTAIVVFSLLVTILTGEVATFSGGEAVLRFLVVVAGGVGVGLVLALLLSKWIELLFNDPLSEITLTMLLAYLSMVLAEGFLHVSGVMAVVVAGLWMSGKGRTKVSPEVSHFLHRFWEMLSYLANTLIFFLVGLVIASTVDSARLSDLLLIGVVYAGVMGIRFGLTYLFQPVVSRLSEGVSRKDSAVVAWGGLRGAVSLALALIVAQNPEIDPTLRSQILLVTGGVVLLTILVNGATIGRLLSKLGYDTPALSEQLATLTGRSFVLDRVHAAIDRVSRSRDLRTVDWGDVEKRLDERRGRLAREIQETREALRAASESERVAAYWHQLISVERQAYWEAFAQGTLGAVAVQLLTAELDRQLDRIARGQLDPPETRTPKISRGLAGLLGKEGMSFDRLALLYDLSRAESVAAERVLESLDELKEADSDVVDAMRTCYRRYLRLGKERIEDMRTHLPEIACAVETRLANRIELNLEREGFETLEAQGVLDPATVHAELHSVEHRMSRLRRGATRVPIPETADLVAKTPLFESLDEAALEELADITEEMVLPAGEYLFREKDKGDSLFVIARGAMHVTKEIGGDEVIVDVLGGGDIIGEIALLTGAPRTASVRSATSVTLGRIHRDPFNRLMDTQPTLRESIWKAFSRRNFDNHVRDLPDFRHLDRDARLAWVDAGHRVELKAGSSMRPEDDARYVFLLTGRVRANGIERAALELLERGAALRIEAISDARLVMLPDPEAVARA